MWRAASAVSLVAAWLMTMLALPWLMAPGTSPGPEGLALPAVQAYVPGFLPGAAPARGARPTSGAAAYPSPAPPPASGLATAAGPGPNAGERPSVTLIAAAASRPNRSGRPLHRSGPGPDVLGVSSPVATPAVDIIPGAPGVVPVAVATTTAAAPAGPTPAPAPAPSSPAPKSRTHDHHGKAETVATVSEQPDTTAERSGKTGRRTTRKQTAPPTPRTRIVTA